MYRGQSLTFTKVYHGIFIKLSQLIKCIFIFDVSSSDEKCLVKFVTLQKTSILLNNLIIKKKKISKYFNFTNYSTSFFSINSFTRFNQPSPTSTLHEYNTTVCTSGVDSPVYSTTAR